MTIRHIYVHDRRHPVKKTGDAKLIEYRGYTIKESSGGAWFVTKGGKVIAGMESRSLEEAKGHIDGVTKKPKGKLYLDPETGATVWDPNHTGDAKLSPEDIAEIKTEKRRKGWSEAQIREYIKEQEAKTVDAGVLKHTETDGNATVKVYWNSAKEEYTCRLFVDGKENVNASYFTSELEGAKNTAKDMARRANTQK